jgi:hypothetical protein
MRAKRSNPSLFTVIASEAKQSFTFPYSLFRSFGLVPSGSLPDYTVNPVTGTWSLSAVLIPVKNKKQETMLCGHFATCK